ncbi:hypothetical protein NDU88_009803 [Pleurodeles waltl]|uniref:Uncharacterized protein n=1 Tax=Pleurodeles waltl TaxID=8319 RepID=A0AAV7RYR4_PLEWA|nr:hypothetical protein NDU88_009803 [Pleurodeles waltl]
MGGARLEPSRDPCCQATETEAKTAFPGGERPGERVDQCRKESCRVKWPHSSDAPAVGVKLSDNILGTQPLSLAIVAGIRLRVCPPLQVPIADSKDPPSDIQDGAAERGAATQCSDPGALTADPRCAPQTGSNGQRGERTGSREENSIQ